MRIGDENCFYFYVCFYAGFVINVLRFDSARLFALAPVPEQISVTVTFYKEKVLAQFLSTTLQSTHRRVSIYYISQRWGLNMSEELPATNFDCNSADDH